MSDEHKAALAQGRAEGRAVRDYLDALRANKPKRGRKRTPDSIKKRIAAIDEQLKSADPLTELRLIQERRDLASELETMSSRSTSRSVEDAFVKVAASYSKRQGISYAAWREVGVPAGRCSSAPGISRGRLSSRRASARHPVEVAQRSLEVERLVERRLVERHLGIGFEQACGNRCLSPTPSSRCAARSGRHRHESDRRRPGPAGPVG